jgi:hypothetical protein
MVSRAEPFRDNLKQAVFATTEARALVPGRCDVCLFGGNSHANGLMTPMTAFHPKRPGSYRPIADVRFFGRIIEPWRGW